MRNLSHISCNKFGRFSIDHTFASQILTNCVLILSIDDFYLRTNFMYVMVEITLSSIVSVNIGSKINSFVIGNKILVASVVDNALMH